MKVPGVWSANRQVLDCMRVFFLLWLLSLAFFFFFLNPHLMTLFLREKGHGRGREKEGQGEKHRCERKTLVGCLLVSSLTEDQTHNLGMCPDLSVYGTMLQATQPHWPGLSLTFYFVLDLFLCVVFCDALLSTLSKSLEKAWKRAIQGLGCFRSER